MRAELQNRVNLLEAILAQRDLELELAAAPEACAHCAPSLDAQRLKVSRDEAIRLLETSATRNRALTEEISVLVQRVCRSISCFSIQYDLMLDIAQLEQAHAGREHRYGRCDGRADRGGREEA